MVMETAPHTPHPPPAAAAVFFDRRELNQLLSLYGRMVAAGHWRDYAIDGLKDAAVFSVFRRSSEVPLYRIEKRPPWRVGRAPGRSWPMAAWCSGAATNWSRC